VVGPGAEVRPAATPAEVRMAYGLAQAEFPAQTAQGPRSADFYAERHPSESDMQIVAVAEGRIVGCALASTHGRSATVGEVVVVPDRRGQGIGRRLLAELERRGRIRGLESLVLGSVDESVNFYVRAGYETILMIQTLEDGDLLERVLTGPLAGTAAEKRHHPGWGWQAFLKLPAPDVGLQRACASLGAHAGWVMSKPLGPASDLEA
jgi:GNAT superfamily N-acetyltransferase